MIGGLEVGAAVLPISFGCPVEEDDPVANAGLQTGEVLLVADAGLEPLPDGLVIAVARQNLKFNQPVAAENVKIEVRSITPPSFTPLVCPDDRHACSHGEYA